MARLIGTDFRPARPWPWLIRLAGPINGLVIGRHTTLDVRPADLALLRSLPTGCLIAPNHSHHYDAQVTFELARRAGRRCIYMATRELFDTCWGLGGWFYQRLGVFSVNRGGTNDEARVFAGKVLASGSCDLLLFPEGEVFLLNDLVMPLKPGVARLALEAGQTLAREGRTRPIFIVPVAIKYRYVENIGPALERLTARLEEKLLGQARNGPLYPRIVAMGTTLLAQAEQTHGVPPVPGDGLFERIERLRKTLLERLERKHFGRVREGPHFERARKLMICIQGSLLASPGTGGYSDAPVVRSRHPLMPDWETARLCANSIAFQKDYLLRNPTPERMAETLVKLEREVLGAETHTFGKRRAVIRVCPPLDIREHLTQHATRPDESIEAVVIHIHNALQAALDAIADESR